MTDYVQNVNSSSTVSLSSGDTLDVLAGVSVAAPGAAAVMTTSGGVEVAVNGSLYGTYGFDDSGTTGSGADAINVASGGSIEGTAEGIVSSNAVDLINQGLVTSLFDIGVYLNGSDSIVNLGTISGLDYAIYSGGSDKISNSGTIASNFNYTIDEAKGGNVIVNSGTMSAADANAVLYVGGGNNTISNSGTIDGGAFQGVQLTDGNDTISNSGTISAQDYAVYVGGTLGGVRIDNSGKMTSQSDYSTIFVTGGGSDTLSNEGTISAGTSNAAAVEITAATGVTFDNSGAITGSVYLTSKLNTVNNSGAVDGELYLVGASSIVNAATGVINQVYLGSPATGQTFVNRGEVAGTTTVSGAGFALDNYGALDGAVSFNGAGANFVNKGTVAGKITFAGNGNTYNGADGSATGAIYAAGSTGTYIGGADADTFVFAANVLSASDVVQGGSGAASDTLKFSTAGAISASTLSNVSGIETIDLANGTNSIALSNALVSTAYATKLTVNGGAGKDTIDASRVSTSAFSVLIDGGAGADFIKAGAAHDTFVYKAAADSTGSAYDTIAGVNFSHDSFHVPGGLGAIKAINAAVTTGSLSTLTFNADLAAAIGATHLGAHDAVLFTASGGTLKGDEFLVVDVNGAAGYQAGKDLVIRLAGASGTLSTANFI